MANETTANQSTHQTQIERLSPIALAYIGDAVFELYVRHKFLMPPKRMANYHRQVVTQTGTRAGHSGRISP